jgi:hypothetical protein
MAGQIDRARAARLMQAAGLDALVLVAPESFRWATGAPAGVAANWRRLGAAIAVVPADPARPVGAVVSGAAIAVAGSAGGATVGGVPLFALAVGVAFAIQWVAFVPAYLLQTEHFYDLTGSLSYITVVTLVLVLAVALAPGEVAPGVVALLCGASLVIAGVALVVVVMRALLAQAIAREREARELRSELDEVI